MECIRCGGSYSGEVVVIKNRYLKRSPLCPTCQDAAQWAEDERKAAEAALVAEGIARAIRYRRDNVEKLLGEASVPPRYRACSRENFEGDFPNYTPAFIHGPIGCGKTHLAVALLRERILASKTREYPNVRFVRMVDLLKEIRATFKDDAQVNEQDLLIYYGLDVDLLVLDDMGVEKITEWVMQTLYDLVDKRYVEMKETIITSNIALENFGKLYGDMGLRLASRIVGMGDILELSGRDRRV
jgi:DNA replication protein DnaC